MESIAWFGFGVMSAPFWWVTIICLIEVALLTRFAVYESLTAGAVSLAVFFGLFYLMGIFNPIAFIWHNALTFIAIFIAYTVVGIGYARFIKWKLYVSDWASCAREFKMEWLSSKNVTGTVITPELENDWKSYLNRNYNSGSIFEPLNIWKHKQRFFTWVAYWPFSALWTLINDPFRRIVNWAYTHLMVAMQKDADRAAAEFTTDYKMSKERNV